MRMEKSYYSSALSPVSYSFYSLSQLSLYLWFCISEKKEEMLNKLTNKIAQTAKISKTTKTTKTIKLSKMQIQAKIKPPL